MKKLAILLLLLLIPLGGCEGKMFHPCPKLSKAYPVIKTVDKVLCLTAGIEWYSAKEKETGRKYLIWFGWDYFNNKEIIAVIDDEKRDEWERLTREEYFNRFEDINKSGYLGWEVIKLKELK